MLELEVLELEVQECWNLCFKWLEIDNGFRFLLQNVDLQIEYDVLKDTDGFHIFQFTYIPDLSRENTDIGQFI